jgi:AcrR family transcriptional regulator
MANLKSTTRRERQIAARLEQILDAAARLFAEKGFDHTTTKEIADAADVAEGTLYNYFDSKNDLIIGMMSRLVESQLFDDHLETAIHNDPRQLFLALFAQQAEHAERYAAMQQAILSEVLEDAELRRRFYQEFLLPIMDMVERQLDLRQKLGQIRPIDAPMVSRTLTSIWLGLFIFKVLGDPLIVNRWDGIAQVAVSLVFDGLTPDPAKKRG